MQHKSHFLYQNTAYSVFSGIFSEKIGIFGTDICSFLVQFLKHFFGDFRAEYTQISPKSLNPDRLSIEKQSFSPLIIVCPIKDAGNQF